ncbi:hypothetical protein D9V32_11940 [Mycetocola tolaasinivorans]|uniref:Uncharacterized protein n=1 Tax=Mycetocola tolaasinivorans TaxID=76635 RepID=A0A3L7A3Q4_9MICO|nr:DUF6804 family protein [Mycetocola tolaasinivorans]RLP74744.1 hypothetical protein D9V32_11940 [Mycetocola tolaasinivorans]
MSNDRYGRGSKREPTFTRPALAPGLLAAIIMMATVALLESDLYYIVRFVVCILTVIVAFYAIRAERPWWLVGLVPVAVFINPIFPLPDWPFTVEPGLVFALTMIFPLVLIGAAVTLKVPDIEEEARRGR